MLAGLEAGDRTVAELVERIYADYPSEVHALAARSVTAHLRKLEREGRVRQGGPGCVADLDGGHAQRLRAVRPAGARPRPVLRAVLARAAAGRGDELVVVGRPTAAARARRSGRAPARRSSLGATSARTARFTDSRVAPTIDASSSCVSRTGMAVPPGAGRPSRRARSSRRRSTRSAMSNHASSVAIAVSRAAVAASPSAPMARSQPRRPQRGRRPRRGQPLGEPQRVARAEQVEQHRAAVGIEDRDGEHAGVDPPLIGARLVLADRRLPGAHDHEGERFDDAHRANHHRHHPPRTLPTPTDMPEPVGFP